MKKKRHGSKYYRLFKDHNTNKRAAAKIRAAKRKSK